MPKLKKIKYRFFTRKNATGETIILTPEGNFLRELENGYAARDIVRQLNKWLKLVGLYV